MMTAHNSSSLGELDHLLDDANSQIVDGSLAWVPSYDRFGVLLQTKEQALEGQLKHHFDCHDFIHLILAAIGGSTAIKGAILTTQGVLHSAGLSEKASAPYDLAVAVAALAMATIVNYNSSPNANTIASMKAGASSCTETGLKVSGLVSGIASGALAFGAPYALAKIFNHLWKTALPAQFGPAMVITGLFLAGVNAYTSYQVGMSGPLNFASTMHQMQEDWKENKLVSICSTLFATYASFFPLVPYGDGIAGFLSGFIGNENASKASEWTGSQRAGYWSFFSLFSIFNVVSLAPYMYTPAYKAGRKFFGAIFQCAGTLSENPRLKALLEHEKSHGSCRYWMCYSLILVSVLIMALCYWIVFAGYTVSTLNFYEIMDNVSAIVIGTTSATAGWMVALVMQMHQLLYSKGLGKGDDAPEQALLRHYINILRVTAKEDDYIELCANQPPRLYYNKDETNQAYKNFDYLFYNKSRGDFSRLKRLPDNTHSELMYYKLNREVLVDMALGLIKVDGMKTLLADAKKSGGEAHYSKTTAIRLPNSPLVDVGQPDYYVDVKFDFYYCHKRGMRIKMQLDSARNTAVGIDMPDYYAENFANEDTTGREALNHADNINYSDPFSA